MKSVSKSIGMLVLGVAIGSLPFTLSMGHINAQDLGRLKPKHAPVQPDNVVADNGSVYIFYKGHVMHMLGSSLQVNQWEKLPDVPRD